MEYFQKFTGIVLFRQEYKEHDMIVKIFSREFGKQMFFVRNLQRSSHPLSAATLPFTDDNSFLSWSLNNNIGINMYFIKFIFLHFIYSNCN